MTESPVSVDRFSWRDILPSLVIFRALPTALGMTVLILSLFAVAATPVGWIAMEKLFVSSELASDAEFSEIAEINRSPWKLVYPRFGTDDSLLSVLGNQLRGVEMIFNYATRSVSGVFSLEPGLGRFFYFLGGAVWTLLVWSFFGCAITRTALMRYTREEPIGIDDAFGFAFANFFSCLAGVSIPILAIFGMTMPLAFAGLLMATNIGAAIGGLLWFVVLMVSLVMAVVVLGLMFAWPLIICAISCEGQDSFDGMSRAFAYVFQRPIHYFVYAVIAVVFSGVCWIVATGLIDGTIHTAHWATSWGMNVSQSERSGELADSGTLDLAQQESSFGRSNFRNRRDDAIDLISNQSPTVENEEAVATGSGVLSFGKRMIQFWNNVARTLGAAFLYGLFWCIAASVYLLLRKDLDDTEMDEIFLVEDRRSYELPPLKDDESGIPQIDEDDELPATVESPEDQEKDDSGDATERS